MELASKLSNIICTEFHNVDSLKNIAVTGDPTILIRKLTGNNLLEARWVTPSILEASSCIEVPRESVSFLPFQDNCFENLPVKLLNKFDKIPETDLYANPYTKIISKSKGTEILCRNFTVNLD